MKTLDEHIDKLIKVLLIKKKRDKDGYYYQTKIGKIYRKSDFIKLIRETLGIDKQCFNCLYWKFDYELSFIEGTKKLICQACAEGIISGTVKLIEE